MERGWDWGFANKSEGQLRSIIQETDMYNNGRGKCKFVRCTSRIVLGIACTTGTTANNERSWVNEKIEAVRDSTFRVLLH